MKQYNKNRPGYKKTPVGWIPEDWEESKLIKIAKINPNSLKENSSNELSFFYIELGMVKEGIIQKPEEKIFFIDAPSRARRQFIKGDILFSTVRPNLKGFAYVEFDSKEFICSTGFSVIQVLNKYDAKFVYYNFFSHNAEKYFFGCVVGSGYPALNNSDVENWKIPLPSLQEQIKISSIISTWYQAIEQTKNLMAAKRQLKKGLMQQLLTGRYRFPKFKNYKMPEKNAFDLPYKWEYKHLGEIAHETVTRNGNKSDLPVVSCTKYEGFVNSMDYFGKKVFGDDISNYKVINRNQFGFPANHVEEGSIGLLIHQEAAIVSPIYIVFEIDSIRVNPHYLYSLLKTKTLKQTFKSMTNASVNRRGSLRWRTFSKIKILLPPIEEQNYIEKFKKHLDNEIGYLQKELQYFQLQKKELTQKLLTGEVRHPDFIKKRITKEE